jgi:hypothetical protein
VNSFSLDALAAAAFSLASLASFSLLTVVNSASYFVIDSLRIAI